VKALENGVIPTTTHGWPLLCWIDHPHDHQSQGSAPSGLSHRDLERFIPSLNYEPIYQDLLTESERQDAYRALLDQRISSEEFVHDEFARALRKLSLVAGNKERLIEHGLADFAEHWLESLCQYVKEAKERGQMLKNTKGQVEYFCPTHGRQTSHTWDSCLHDGEVSFLHGVQGVDDHLLKMIRPLDQAQQIWDSVTAQRVAEQQAAARATDQMEGVERREAESQAPAAEGALPSVHMAPPPASVHPMLSGPLPAHSVQMLDHSATSLTAHARRGGGATRGHYGNRGNGRFGGADRGRHGYRGGGRFGGRRGGQHQHSAPMGHHNDPSNVNMLLSAVHLLAGGNPEGQWDGPRPRPHR